MTPELSHTMDIDVHIFDTDCFGVMWHGAYVKWLEMGRVKLLESLGIILSSPDVQEWIFPVAEQRFRFRSPAAYGDQLALTTSVRVESYKLIFPQSFVSERTGKVTLEAETTVVITDRNWRPQRRLPSFLQEALQQGPVES